MNYGDEEGQKKERQFEAALRLKKVELEKALGDRAIPKCRNLRTIAKKHAGKVKIFGNPHYGVFSYGGLWNNPVEALWRSRCQGLSIEKAYNEYHEIFVGIARPLVLLFVCSEGYEILGDNGRDVVVFDKTGTISLDRRFS